MTSHGLYRLVVLILLLNISLCSYQSINADDSLDQMKKVKEFEKKRIDVIKKISPSVVCIFGKNPGGGGSGVIFDINGYLITNFHVVRSVGLEGLGGISDGKLYPMDVFGIDPGGDLAIAKLRREKKFTKAIMGDSNKVMVGDLCMALGNPFLLAEDYTPTVTYGVVSGVKRYQEGEGRILVYGNCIQIDSSINPGNSGGPLFTGAGKVIGINGRGSFEERGRVNVGLGYAISMEQILNFIPDLLSTKICQHATLDAVFADRRDGVKCVRINLDSDIGQLGMNLGDTLIEVDHVKIKTANEYTNLITTYPAHWPVQVKFKSAGVVKEVYVRLKLLPYDIVKKVDAPEGKKKIKEPKNVWGKPGIIRDKVVNSKECLRLIAGFQDLVNPERVKIGTLKSTLEIIFDGKTVQNVVVEFSGIDKQIVTIEKASSGLKESFEINYLKNSGVNLKGNTKLDEDQVRYVIDNIEPLLQYYFLLKKTASFAKEFSLIGGDKANGRRAFKLKLGLNDKLDWLIWLNVVDDDISFKPRLLKLASTGKDEETSYGNLLSDFHDLNGLSVPKSFKMVKGLDEKLIREIKVKKITFTK